MGAGLELAFANARLIPAYKPADIAGMADIKQGGERKEERSEPPLPCQRKHTDARHARDERRERRVAGEERHQQPCGSEQGCRRPIESEQNAYKGGDAFAAVEAE